MGDHKISSKLTCMVGRMGGRLHFLVEIELEMAKMPAFANLKGIV